jgi:ABC-type antimicrobial peptide transport system permease subunit
MRARRRNRQSDGTTESPEGFTRRSRLRFADLYDETLAGIFARPGRAALTTAGTVIGLASLVATLGISRTAGNQIVERFDELQATQVSVRVRSSGGDQEQTGVALPWDVEHRLDVLNGVVASGAVADVANAGGVRTVPVIDPSTVVERTVPVVAASSGFLDAVRGHISSGRWFDDGHVARADRVVIIGVDLADDLGIHSVAAQPGLFIGEDLFVVIGIVDDAPRDRGLLGSIIMPSTVAAARFDVARPERVVIETDLGAAAQIARQATTALNPNAPETLSATAPAEPTRTRDDVQTDVNGLFLLLGLISLVVGAIGIANVTLVTVMERTGEIGLRRALGARRWHIGGQILCESAAMGMVGGIVGASLGIVTVVAVSANRGWTPLLDPWLPFLAPPVGALVGLIAGAYPALRAARLEPVEALRSGV